MHAFHQYILDQRTERLNKHRVVVWYDPRAEFRPFLQDVLGVEPSGCRIQTIDFDGMQVGVCVSCGSLFEIKFVVEPQVEMDEPQPLLIYMPAARPDRTESPLAELEQAGDTYEPQLKRLARNVLRHQYSDGQIDDMLASDVVSYADVVGLLAEDDGRQKSMLKVIFADARDNGQLLADWIGQPELDNMVQEKAGGGEILQLARSRLGLELDDTGDLADARRQVLRYVLVGEFRGDYDGEPPAAAAMIPAPAKKEQQKFIGEVAVALRRRHPEVYATLADRVESELGLSSSALPPERLGRIDTFRFEERSLLCYVGQLIVDHRYEEAAQLVADHRRSFWTDRDLRRQNQWEVCRWMAELGVLAREVRRTLPAGNLGPAAWIERYTGVDGWYRLDLTQRRLECLVAGMTEDPECEAALNRVRADYEAVLQEMATGFLNSLREAGWSTAGVLNQSRTHTDLVAGGGRTAYFLVDSLRYEMGVELREQLSDADELALAAAAAAIPTITPISMAALMPGAATSFTVTDSGGELAASVDGSPLPGLQARQKYLKSRVPDVVDLELGRLLGMAPSDLRKRKNFDNASLIVVRSQDIDAFGETGSNHLARQVMDTAVGNIARAIRKLADLGVERFVITADHGHLFTWAKEESMRMDSPGGQTLDLHRRCWIGRGGTTPAGAVRINGAELGYGTDLDFVFPSGISVFRAGGDLAYHHGGLSLQELVIPILVVRMARRVKTPHGLAKVAVSDVPTTLTNRTFGVTVSVPVDIFHPEPISVRPVLLHGGVLVGEAGMALDADYDQKTHCVVVQPGKSARVAMFLQNDNCDKVRLIVLDPATDAVLFQSNDIQIRLGTR